VIEGTKQMRHTSGQTFHTYLHEINKADQLRSKKTTHETGIVTFQHKITKTKAFMSLSPLIREYKHMK